MDVVKLPKKVRMVCYEIMDGKEEALDTLESFADKYPHQVAAVKAEVAYFNLDYEKALALDLAILPWLEEWYYSNVSDEHMLGTKLQGKYGHLGFKYKKSDKTLTRHSKNFTYMIAFSSFGGNTKDSISIEVCYIINTRPYDPYGYAKPDINTQPLFYSLRDNEIYLDIGNEEKIYNAFEVVCQWMDKILIPKMNELCATE